MTAPINSVVVRSTPTLRELFCVHCERSLCSVLNAVTSGAAVVLISCPACGEVSTIGLRPADGA
jgi:hypothetical protein